MTTTALEPATAREDELSLLACITAGYDPRPLPLTPELFYEPRHAAAYSIACDIATNGQQITPELMRVHLGDKEATWLLELYSRPVVSLNAPIFAERVARAAGLRRAQQISIQLMQAATQPDADPDKIMADARTALAAPTTQHQDLLPIQDLLPAVIDDLTEPAKPGIPTPWADINRKIHGLQPGRLYTIGGLPGQGKSLMLGNITTHAARKAHKVMLVSLEMNPDEILHRMLAEVGRVELDHMLTRDLSDTDWSSLTTATGKLMDSPIMITTTPSLTIDQIRSRAHHMANTVGLDLLVVDYLQLITPRDRKTPREQQVAEAALGLKILAKELGVPVVAAAQLRRPENRDQRPSMASLRESGGIENNSDVVMLLHIPNLEEEWWEAEVIIAKARNGSRGVINMFLETKHALIRLADTRTW